MSTDAGSRGFDTEEVALVINRNVPSEPEECTHWVGRTGREGSTWQNFRGLSADTHQCARRH